MVSNPILQILHHVMKWKYFMPLKATFINTTILEENICMYICVYTRTPPAKRKQRFHHFADLTFYCCLCSYGKYAVLYQIQCFIYYFTYRKSLKLEVYWIILLLCHCSLVEWHLPDWSRAVKVSSTWYSEPHIIDYNITLVKCHNNIYINRI